MVSEDTFYPRIDIDKIITQENNFDVIDVQLSYFSCTFNKDLVLLTSSSCLFEFLIDY